MSVVPDVSNLRSVLEEPAIGDFVLPSNISGVLPQETDLLRSVSCVPEGVPQILSRTSLGFHNLVIRSETASGGEHTKLLIGGSGVVPNV